MITAWSECGTVGIEWAFNSLRYSNYLFSMSVGFKLQIIHAARYIDGEQ